MDMHATGKTPHPPWSQWKIQAVFRYRHPFVNYSTAAFPLMIQLIHLVFPKAFISIKGGSSAALIMSHVLFFF